MKTGRIADHAAPAIYCWWYRSRAFAAGLLVLALVGCWRNVATIGVMMHLQVRVEHADGRPATAVDLWYVDHGLTRRQRQAILPKSPVCTTDSTGNCAAQITYLYSKQPFRWVLPWRSEYDRRFETRTLLNGKERSLGFLQVATRKGSLIEGTMVARID
jgi:hypothetical protein